MDVSAAPSFKKSIRYRILKGICLLLFISTCLLSGTMAYNVDRMLQESLTSKGKSLATTIAKRNENALMISGSTRLENVLIELITDEEIAYTTIADSQGKLLTSQFESINYNWPGLKAILPNLPKGIDLPDFLETIKKNGHVREISLPIMLGVDFMGQVTIGLSETRIREQITTTVLFVVALNLIIALVLATALFIASKKIILDPIVALSKATRRLAAGYLTTKVDIKSSGEIQMLADSFNQMAENLNTSTVSKKYVDNIINSMMDSLVVLSPEKQIVLINPATCRLLGYDAQELTGKSMAEIFYDSDAEYRSLLDEILATGSVTNMETSYRTKNGKKVLILFSGSLITEGSTVTGIVCVAIDITERKQAEDERRRLVTAIEQGVDSVIITDETGLIQYVNPSFEQLTGYTKEEVIGRNPSLLQSGKHDAHFYQEMWRTLASGKVWQGHLINKKKDGTLFDEEASIKPVLNEDGEIINHVAVKRDVTERMKLGEQLKQAQKMESIGTLAGGIAHDFNNILSAILGYAELAKQRLPPETAAQDDIDQIIQSGIRAAALVRQILDFSRKTEQKLQPLQPHLIVQDVLQMLDSTMPTSVEFEEDIDPACGTIMADSTKFHQVVLNLCTNAFQALKDEKGTLRITLSRQERNAKDVEQGNGSPVPFIVLSVSDTGQGMDQETAAHIFDPYFTTKELGTRKGTGLGLAIVHGIVEGYNGFIEVESETGRGSTFRVFIPEWDKSHSTPEIQIHQRALPSGTERILVVDDEPMLVRINTRVLEVHGYRVTGVTDSREALEIVRAEPKQFDLIVTDQTMPGLSGSELAKAVLEIAPDMPIIICSGHSTVISAEDAYAMGFKRYVHKPIQGDTLARTVRMVLDERK